MTFEEARGLKIGNLIHHDFYRNKKDQLLKFKVIGKPKTWKTRPEEMVISVKYGLRVYKKFNEKDLCCLTFHQR